MCLCRISEVYLILGLDVLIRPEYLKRIRWHALRVIRIIYTILNTRIKQLILNKQKTSLPSGERRLNCPRASEYSMVFEKQ